MKVGQRHTLVFLGSFLLKNQTLHQGMAGKCKGRGPIPSAGQQPLCHRESSWPPVGTSPAIPT